MKKIIAVFQRPGSLWDSNKPVRAQAYWDDHARFMDALFDDGEVILGGPFVDGSGSLVILAAESVEAARTVFQKDPWNIHDVLVAREVKEWTIFLDGRDKRQG